MKKKKNNMFNLNSLDLNKIFKSYDIEEQVYKLKKLINCFEKEKKIILPFFTFQLLMKSSKSRGHPNSHKGLKCPYPRVENFFLRNTICNSENRKLKIYIFFFQLPFNYFTWQTTPR